MEIVFRCAYGSSKDISVYQSLEMSPDRIYTVGKVSKKQQSLTTVLLDGYVAHLDELRKNASVNMAQNSLRIILPRSGFCGTRNRQSTKAAKRTTSFPINSTSNTNNHEIKTTTHPVTDSKL